MVHTHIRRTPHVELDVGRALDQCASWHGSLTPDIRDRIQVLIESPSQESWDDAHGIILSVKEGTGLGMTLWEAILAVDPTFPTRGQVTTGPVLDPETGEVIASGRVISPWPRVPEPELVIRAIYYATGGCPPGSGAYLVQRRPDK